MDKGNSKFVVIGAIVLVALLGLSIYYVFVKKQVSPEKNETAVKDIRTVRTINVTASGGKFNPSEIKTELFADVDLAIKAEDNNYQFIVDGYPRFDTEIQKGETKKVQLYSLGVGEYNYTCGNNCSGKIVVNQQVDTSEDDN